MAPKTKTCVTKVSTPPKVENGYDDKFAYLLGKMAEMSANHAITDAKYKSLPRKNPEVLIC